MKKTKKFFMSGALALGAVLAMTGAAMADEGSKDSVAERTKEAGRDIEKSAKKAGRKVKDETCELVNGKMECAAKKMKHGAQNAADEVRDATNADQD